MDKYDFSGWATRNNLKCSDGKTILKDAFKVSDGQQVPLVWNHGHSDPFNVLGHAVLENREDGVYAYCTFNDTENGQNAKKLVQHGDISALSIYANQLKKDSANNVHHGVIREVSLVLAGANPGALIDSVIAHSDENAPEFEAQIFTNEALELYHAEGSEKSEGETGKMADETKKTEAEETAKSEEGKTVKDVWDTLNDEQKDLVYAIVAATDEGKEDKKDDKKEEKEGEKEMKQNVFDKDNETNTLSHSDQESIIALAKNSRGSLQDAIRMYAADTNNEALAHGIDSIEELFPEFKDVKSGAPELLTDDQSWVSVVMNKVHKSPISRIRTRQAEARRAELKEALRAKGFKKGQEKKISANIALLSRTTDPQTIYRKDALNRDDIIDITDFDVVDYQYKIMRMNLNEELATAILIGDGREEGAEDKISENHIRSIWNDKDLYTIHYDVDVAAAKKELQGSNTAANFGENYIYAEAIVQAALYSREQYKGSGSLDFYCTPHLLNVMLLARDLNGRRIYDSKNDLAAALNVNSIHTVEQFEGKTRTYVDEATSASKTKKLLGLFVNLADYQVGSTKGGEITKFNQFDIDFNQEKYLIETRVSGALTKVYSAIALEEDVTVVSD